LLVVPVPACPTSPMEEITGMTPEEYRERERTPRDYDWSKLA
jgi:hypothetical protein